MDEDWGNEMALALRDLLRVNRTASPDDENETKNNEAEGSS